jgi:hypothetical protein
MVFPTVNLLHRDNGATVIATCSDVSLDIRIEYSGLLDNRTPIQRQIESLMPSPDTAHRVLLGELEFYFRNSAHLTGISLYSNFAAAPIDNKSTEIEEAEPVWLTFPELDLTDRDVISYQVPVHVFVRQNEHRVRLLLGEPRACRRYAIADGLWIGLDEEQKIGDLIISGIVWTGSPKAV